MVLTMLIRSLSGIRGIVGQDLTPSEVLDYSSRFGRFCGKGRVAVGRDSRPTGEALKSAAVAGLLATGCEVVDLGIVPTPSALLSVKALECAGGIVITASHNPMEWNGLKLINSSGIFLDAEETNSMYEMKEGWAGFAEHGALIEDELCVERHIEKILALGLLDLEGMKRRSFKVVIDTCNGAAYRAGPQLLRALGCEVITMNCELTGTFPRPTEPNPSLLNDLKDAAIELGADVGFATDPDADRLGIVSKSEQPLGEEYTLALATELVLSKERGKVVTNVSTSSLIDWVARRHAGEVVRTPIGEAHVVRKILASQALIGGEGNGGVILPRVHPTRDSLTGMALALQLLLERDVPLETIIEGFPSLRIIKKKVTLEGDFRESELRDHFADAEVDETDGLLFKYADSWLSVRKSGTEPIVRVIAEAPTEERALALVDRAIGLLPADDGGR